MNTAALECPRLAEGGSALSGGGLGGQAFPKSQRGELAGTPLPTKSARPSGGAIRKQRACPCTCTNMRTPSIHPISRNQPQSEVYAEAAAWGTGQRRSRPNTV